MKELETKSGGIYKASAGAIYPVLQQLEDQGMVTSDTAAGKRTYSLTEAGKAELQREAETVNNLAARRAGRRLGAMDGDGGSGGDASTGRGDEDGAKDGHLGIARRGEDREDSRNPGACKARN
jgi:DNA-binding PadR family transcriptional regulator